MSSNNKPIIDTLISAISGGINPGQNTDLMRRIGNDLDTVFSQVNNPGGLPRILQRSEIDPNVAYIDVTNIFSKANTFQLTITVAGISSLGGILVTGGAIAASSIVKDATFGIVISGVAGVTNDFTLTKPDGTKILEVPTGTINIQIDGLVGMGVAPATYPLRVSNSINGNFIARIDNTHATHGFGLLIDAGNDTTNFPLQIFDVGFSNHLFDVDGAGNLFWGRGYSEVKKMTAPGSSPANTGRFFLRDNGAGKMQFAAIFPSGAIQVIATEP